MISLDDEDFVPSTKAKQRALLDTVIFLQAQAIEAGDWPTMIKTTDALRRLRAQLHNRKPTNSPRPAGHSFTPDLKREVLNQHLADPDRAWQSIAQDVNISIGRVSELLRGKRT